MSRRDARAFLWDVVNSAQLIEEFAHGVDEDHFVADAFVQAAVERHLIIIGEAVGCLDRVAPDVAAKLGVDISGVVGVRNVLVHGYDGVDPREIFTIICRDVPVLSKAARRLLDRSA